MSNSVFGNVVEFIKGKRLTHQRVMLSDWLETLKDHELEELIESAETCFEEPNMENNEFSSVAMALLIAEAQQNNRSKFHLDELKVVYRNICVLINAELLHRKTDIRFQKPFSVFDKDIVFHRI